MIKRYVYILCIWFPISLCGQNIALFEQFNGRYDYTAIGNTLNPFENNLVQSFCYTLPSSQATLSLENTENIIAAYLYWAGSGEADSSIVFNMIPIDADWVFSVDFEDANYATLSYFSCVANDTDVVLTQGNTAYDLSDLDISENLLNNTGYCGTRTNFAGWALYVIYEDDDLPLNQINLFQGLENINRNVQEKTIVLENLNVKLTRNLPLRGDLSNQHLQVVTGKCRSCRAARFREQRVQGKPVDVIHQHVYPSIELSERVDVTGCLHQLEIRDLRFRPNGKPAIVL